MVSQRIEVKEYLGGGEAPQGVPLLGEPFDHGQGGGHVSLQRVGEQAICSHLHLS